MGQDQRVIATRAEEFRRKAAECRSQAVAAIEHDTKAGWMKLADKWERMAEEADPAERAAPRPKAAPAKTNNASGRKRRCLVANFPLSSKH